MATYYYLSPTISALQAITLATIIAAAILAALNAPRRLLYILLTLIAALHATYMITYVRTYNLSTKIYPLLDITYDNKGHATVTLDLAQLSLIILAILTLTRERRHITPKAT